MKTSHRVRCLHAFAVVFGTVFSLILIPIRNFGTPVIQPPPDDPPPCEATNCIPAIYSITNLVVLPSTNICLGASLSVSNSSVSVAGTNIVIDSACEATTNIVGHTLLTNIWIATVGSWSITNIQVPPTDEPWSVTPTNCGQGTVSLTTYYLDGCDGLASSSAQKTFLVSSVDIFEPEKIVCACDTASFTLTNTCGEVTWEVQGAMNPGDPMVVSNSIVAGTNCGSWTVVARSKDNTNCSGLAVLKVVGAGSLTVSGAGIPGATNSQMFTVCPVPTNAANPYVTVTASPCPEMHETNLPACWQLTGGIGTNRLWRQVDRRQLGTNTLTAAAECSSNTVVIIVADTVPPTISGATGLPPVCTDAGSCSAVVTFGGISATDDCYLASWTISPPSGTSFTKGTHTIKVTARDLGNNTTTNTFVLTVNDCEKPVITCPSHITVCGSSTASNIVTWITPTATDNCGTPIVTSKRPSGSSFPAGVTSVSYTATDSSSNMASCSFKVRVVALSIEEVGFTGDYLITEWTGGALIDSPDGSSPVWKKTANPDKPVAHTKGAQSTLFAKFGITPTLSTAMTVSVRVKNGTNVVGVKNGVVVPSGATSVNVEGIATTVSIEGTNTVKKTTPTLTWEMSCDGANWHGVGDSGPHTMYWTDAAPNYPPFADFNGVTYAPLYDFALEKACSYVNGDSDLFGKIATGIDVDINYKPADPGLTGHPLDAYSHSGGCMCADLAYLLRGMLRTIGADGNVTFYWAGPNNTTERLYLQGSTTNEATFRITRALHDGAAANPHFTYHAVVPFGGMLYDPSYGISYSSLAFTETSPGETQRSSITFPTSAIRLNMWTCPH